MISQRAALKRVLVLAPNVLGSDGIASVTRQVLGCWESDNRYRVDVWSLLDRTGSALCDTASVKYRIAEANRKRFIFWGLRAATARQSGTTVLAMHLSLAPVALPLVLRGAGLNIFLHGVEAWRRVRAGEAIALRRARCLIANSNHTARGFKAANPEFADREVIVCPLGVDVPASDLPAIARAVTRTQRSALIVGRMSSEERYKGHDLLIDLWPSIVSRVPGATLTIAGDGDDRARLEAKAQASSVSSEIRFLGRVSDAELRTLYQECEFFVMPSRGEGFGLVFLEAMQAGRACLGGIGAAAEVIEHGVTGLIVDPTDTEDVGDAIVRLFSDQEVTKRMGRAGAERFADHFTAAHFRRRFRALLESPKGGC